MIDSVQDKSIISQRLFNLFTLVIPTYNRYPFLLRLLRFYKSYNYPFKIIVLDSSSDLLELEELKSLLAHERITYQDFDSNIFPDEKIARGLEYVKTPYAALCADDDFITLNGINQSVAFLEKNPDFTVAHGHYISFWIKTGKKAKQQFCWQPIYPYKSILFSDEKSRLHFHFSNYCPNFYAVYRTDFLKMILKETIKFADEPVFGELLLSMLALIYGKMKRLDVLYAARENIPGSAATTYENLKDFIRAGTYDEKYARFRDCLAMHLSRKSQLNTEESKSVVDESMAAYMGKYFGPTNYKDVLINKTRDILDYLRLPDWIHDGIRSMYRKLFLSKQFRLNDFLSSLDVPSSKYYNDFNTIRSHVLSYSKK